MTENHPRQARRTGSAWEISQPGGRAGPTGPGSAPTVDSPTILSHFSIGSFAQRLAMSTVRQHETKVPQAGRSSLHRMPNRSNAPKQLPHEAF
jgi:hypothetical protein